MIEPSAALDPRFWEVEVRISGERVLTIGHNHLSGLDDIDRYGDTVRLCAEHLRAFIGSGEAPPCFACNGSGQERWVGYGGAEEVGPCSVCSDPAESTADDGGDGVPVHSSLPPAELSRLQHSLSLAVEALGPFAGAARASRRVAKDPHYQRAREVHSKLTESE